MPMNTAPSNPVAASQPTTWLRLPACMPSMATPKVKLLSSSTTVSESTKPSLNSSLPLGPSAVPLSRTPKVANSTAKIRQSPIRYIQNPTTVLLPSSWCAWSPG
ncbi:hypothetical protein D3C71_702560 [compost metagenome]